jgi:aspartate-semialdehyde dehydrogenase
MMHNGSTGTTGYVGGDALFAFNEAHPDWTYSVLVRSEEKASQVTKAFPSAKPVIGSLDDSAVIEEQAAQADIIVRKST